MTEPDIFEPPVFYCTDAIHRDIQDRARAEATAAAEQRLRERIAALREYPAWHACIERVLALLDTPPPASPRQGEPVEGGRCPVAASRCERPVGHEDDHYTAFAPDDLWGWTVAAALSEPAEAGEPG